MSLKLKLALAPICIVAAVSLAAAAVAAGRSSQAILHVRPGESIQAAIDRAQPGDTIVIAAGVYRENLTITTDGLTLRGAGARLTGTVLQPAATPHPSVCTEFGEVNGVCITGRFKKGTAVLGKPIRNVTLSGVLVRNFSRMGILVYNALDTVVTDDRVSHNHRYGLAAFSLAGIRIVDDIADANGQGSIHVGDAANARALVSRNRVYANHGSGGIGIYVRAASNGLMSENRVDGNCAGIVLANSTREPMRGWDVHGNVVHANTLACSAVEGGPPLSGLGIALLGTDHFRLHDNVVTANRPGEKTPLVGGVLVASSRAFGGLDPSGNQLRGNRVTGNLPADVIYDRSGKGNTFLHNTCRTSIPASLCARS
jgi:parallel beta-helix repeat protein